MPTVFGIINRKLAQDMADTQFGLSLPCNNPLLKLVA